MARKSKGFSELLRQRKGESQDRQKSLEELGQKLQRGPFRELAPEMVTEPSGVEKMSEVLKQFVAPYKASTRGTSDYRTLLRLAVMAWNTSFLPEAEQQKIVDQVAKEGLVKPDAQIQQDIKELFEELITRKKRYFSSCQRFIADFNLRDTGKQYHLSVASFPASEKHEETTDG